MVDFYHLDAVHLQIEPAQPHGNLQRRRNGATVGQRHAPPVPPSGVAQVPSPRKKCVASAFVPLLKRLTETVPVSWPASVPVAKGPKDVPLVLVHVTARLPAVVQSPERLPEVIVFEPEKTGRLPAAGLPDGAIAESTQPFRALKLLMTAVASATWPLLIEFGTVHAALAGPVGTTAPSATVKARIRSRAPKRCLSKTFNQPELII